MGRAGRRPALSAARLPVRPARDRLRVPRHGLGAPLPGVLARRRAGGSHAALPEIAFARRVRVRLCLGRCLPAPRHALLPQAAVGHPLHPGDGAATAGGQRRRPRHAGARPGRVRRRDQGVVAEIGSAHV
ncbi:hypothetical protein G6F35_015811 [Rhizopus arrhizus]|nr:hypothetical protein G6F35_015811 [Rhizopus arrhizus]